MKTFVTVLTLTGSIFLIIGTICVVCPYKIQEFAWKLFAFTARISQGRVITSSPFLNWIKSRSYILLVRIIGVLLTGMGFFLIVSFIGWHDPRREIIIEGPTKVVADSECSYHKNAKVIAVLNKGNKVQVLGEQMQKACSVFKVKLADGRVGYVTAGDEFVRSFEYYNTMTFAVIEDSTNVMSKPDSVHTPDNTVIAVLHKGDKVIAISGQYFEGAAYYSVMLNDGRTGYLKWNDKFSLVGEKD